MARQARRVAFRNGTAGIGKARQARIGSEGHVGDWRALVRQARHGSVRLGTPGHVMERFGRHGWVSRVLVSRGEVCKGEVRQARRGRDWRVMARSG